MKVITSWILNLLSSRAFHGPTASSLHEQLKHGHGVVLANVPDLSLTSIQA